mgnify:FL=1
MESDRTRTYFDSLESAIASWGKRADEPWKIAEARRALDLLIELKGAPTPREGRAQPTASDGYAREATPYYVPTQSWQYVAVTWSGQMGLQLQKGFMQAVAPLAPGWEMTERPPSANQREAWYKLPFPDHLEFGKADESRNPREGECQCSPGELQPRGSACYRCEEPIP